MNTLTVVASDHEYGQENALKVRHFPSNPFSFPLEKEQEETADSGIEPEKKR